MKRLPFFSFVFSSVLLWVLSSFAAAQFLPTNSVPLKPLTKELLTRWIATNSQIHDYTKVIDDMLPTDAEAKAFEKLSVVEQDRLVNNYLNRKGLFEPLNTTIKKAGWTGVADYMRASTQIGNAIAAYFQADIIAKLPPEQAKAMAEKTDPAIKAVPAADIVFIKNNLNLLKEHIQHYSQQ